MDLNKDFETVYCELKKAKVFDTESFERLLEDTSQEVVLKILARFWISLQEALEQIQTGVESDDADAIYRACHKVAGSAELIGFSQFGKQSRQLNLGLKTIMDPQSHLQEINSYLCVGHNLVEQIKRSFPTLQKYL